MLSFYLVLNMLWNRNFTLLIAANAIAYMVMYYLFVLVYRLALQFVGPPSCAISVSAVFALGVLLPGGFNNYLVDAFSRKRVCTFSMFIILILTLCYPYVSGWEALIGLRLLQGVMFGIILASIGSTLVIDVTSGEQRDKANHVCAQSAVLGQLLGIVLGMQVYHRIPFDRQFYLVAGFCLIFMILIAMVRVCFRAPLNVPICSFDRFILFRALPPALNMMSVPIVLGMTFVSYSLHYSYFCMAAGFLLGVKLHQLCKKSYSGQMQISLGYLLLAGGAVLSYFAENRFEYCVVGGVLSGIGIAMTLRSFVRLTIALSRHCERGTGYHTHQLLWEVGIAVGVCLGVSVIRTWELPWFAVTLAICVAGWMCHAFCIRVYCDKIINLKQ